MTDGGQCRGEGVWSPGGLVVGCSRAWAEGMGGRRPVSSGIDRYRIFWVSLGLGIDWVKSCDRPHLS